MESIKLHNYYEKLVIERVMDITDRSYIDSYVEDIACIALNHLPPRYIRHDIDMAFYLTHDERQTMEMHIQKAVKNAIKSIYSNQDLTGRSFAIR